MTNYSITVFPAQKVSSSQKTEEWYKQCVDVAENIAIVSDTPLRESSYNKSANYDLFNNKLNIRDMQKVLNPLNLTHATFPAKMQHYPIGNTKLERLIGEEPNRKFDFIVRVINDDAVSSKEEERKKQLFSAVLPYLQMQNPDQESLKKELQRLSKYYNYEYQDIRELTATRLLSYFFKTMNLRWIFNMGFADALIAGEECFCVDIVSGEPVVYKPNMQNLYVIRSGDQTLIDDADIIVESSFKSIGQVVDEYYDYLTSDEIKSIEHGMTTGGDNVTKHLSLTPQMSVQDIVGGQIGNTDLIYVNELGINLMGGAYDLNGNIKITKVTWKSMKKVGKITFSDNLGNELSDYVPEDYKPEKGEKIKWLWVSEWHEGTKIGNDIYVKMQPRPFQMRRMDNISVCKSGYIGNIYSFNLDRAQSLMDRIKPYSYLYDIFMYRTELAFAKAKGIIAELNISMVPEGWDLDKWMYYMDVMGFYMVNPFSEVKEGAAKGKLAGMFNTVGGRTMDLSLGNYIQQHIAMLQYIEEQIGQVSGVPRQREGHTEQRDAVRNVQQTIIQSSFITERWYMVHDSIKVRVLEALLEAAKQAWRGKSKKMQYVLDDLSTVFINIDDDFTSSEYGIYISTVLSDMQIMNDLREAMMASVSRDKLSISSMIDFYMSDSVAAKRRMIERGEQEAHKRATELAGIQNQSADKAIQSKVTMDRENQINESITRDREHRNAMELMEKQEQLKTERDVKLAEMKKDEGKKK